MSWDLWGNPHGSDPALVGIALGALLLLPLALVVLLRGRALPADVADPAPVWFGFARATSFVAGNPRAGVVLAGAVFVSRIGLLWLQLRAMGIAPHAVTAGPLRDRIFGLAGQAGVRLQQLYVVPMARGRMANAFAVRGNLVVLTDYLL